MNPTAIGACNNSLCPKNHAVFFTIESSQCCFDILNSKLLSRFRTPRGKHFFCMMMVVMSTATTMFSMLMVVGMVMMTTAMLTVLMTVGMAVMTAAVFTVFVVVFAIVVYSMTNSKNLAVILGFVLEIAVVVLYSMFPEMLITGFDAMLSSFALFNRLNNFYFGMLDLGALAYYLSVCALFVLFTVQSIEKRRWS